MNTQFFHKNRGIKGFNHDSGAASELAPASLGVQSSQAMLASAIEHLAPAMFIVAAKESECPIVHVSPGFTVITCYTPEDAVGRDLTLLQGLNTNVAAMQFIQQCLAEAKPFQGELLCYRKNVAPAWCALTLTPLPGTEEPRYFAGLLTDISAHKRREAQLENSEAKFRGIFENAVEGIYQSTPDGRYLAANLALARMYGYDNPGELLRNVSDIQNQIYVEPKLRQEFQREIELTGLVDSREYQARRRDGKIIWISESARAVRGPEGAVLYYEGFIDDITARKDAEAARARLEKQMVQAQKMEAVGTLAGGVAHDFNNILCAMVGFTELVLAERSIKGAARENLEAVLHSTGRATDLVKRILTFSRRTETEHRPLRMGEILKECIKLLNASLPSYIQIKSSLRTNDDVVMADMTEMHQVIMNLGSNAAHAMRPKGGQLHFELEAADLTVADAAALSVPPGSYLGLTVRDTGHGMSRAVLENIFDPFFTTKPVGQGTGLGLTLVSKIVASSGGHISVESEVGQGTTFRILLPRMDSSVLAIEDNQKQILPGNGERILVVDDEIPILMMMQQRLRKLGYRVLTRADSVGALELFRLEPDKFDLVITDHTMPNLQGADFAEKLGEVRADIPVILMTGLNQPPDLSSSRYAAHRVVVQKPISFIELSHQMRAFLEPDKALAD